MTASVFVAGCGARRSQAPIVTDAAYHQALTTAQNAGFALKSPAQPMPPDNQNAAVIYDKLTQYLSLHPLTKTDMSDATYSVSAETPAQIERIRSLIKRRSEIVRLAHLAAERPKCIFQRKSGILFSDAISSHEFFSMREATRFLSLESLVMAHDGQEIDAVQNQASGFRIAQHAGSGGTIIGLLAQIACEHITFRGLQNVIQETHGSSYAAKAIRQVIENDWHQPLLAPELRQETATQISFIEQSRRVGPGPSAKMVNGKMVTFTRKVSGNERQQWNSDMNANGINLLEQMRPIIAAADLPYPEAHAKAKAIVTAMNHAAPQTAPSPPQVFDGEVIPRLSNHTYTDYFLTAFMDSLDVKTLDTAIATITTTAASIFEYQAAHGALPATLADLGSPVPVDPFDLKPLRYRREGKGFVVYSVGQTLNFDGGLPGAKTPNTEAVFRYTLNMGQERH